MFPNFEDFVEKIKIPFYEDYKIRLVNDTDDPSSVCFAFGEIIRINYYVGLFFAFIILII